MRATENLLMGFGMAWKQLTFAAGESEGNGQHFSGSTESREPGAFFLCAKDQSIFVLL